MAACFLEQQPGYYTTAYETAFCDSIIGLNLTFKPSSMEVTISGNTQINSGESTTLTASGAETYLWSTGETTASITVSPTETTTYTVTGFNNDGCEAQAEITVTVAGTSVDENSLQVIEIIPNPANDKIQVKAEELKSVCIYNAYGQMVSSYSETDTIDVSSLSNGIYYIQIGTTFDTTTQKVLICH